MHDSDADSSVGVFEQSSRLLTITGTSKSEGGADVILEQVLIYDVCSAEPLTRRESEILQLIIQGLPNKQIARLLCRSERTVEYHRNRLMRKMGVRNAAGLVKRAIAIGLA